MAKLIDGKIPAFTECPYKSKCNPEICNHQGSDHQVAFSCAFARAYELLEKRQKEKIKNGVY